MGGMVTVHGCLLVLLVAVLSGRLADGRQMCMSCSFQTGVGEKCLDDPWNWANGDPRVRCPRDCFLDVRRDNKTKEYFYAYRGCTPEGSTIHESSCWKAGDKELCYFVCSGADYCNNWNATDVFPAPAGGAAATALPWSHFRSGLFLAAVSTVAVAMVAVEAMIW